MSGSISDLLRTVFMWIDLLVYSFVDHLYNLFSLLAEATIFTNAQIESFSNRIYVLVSIIMFFRLGFAFVTYIVNPESFSDKQKGGGALIKKIVITMALLVSVPTIFNEAYYVQQLVFKNNIIDKVLLGDTTTQIKKADRGKSLSTYAFLSFFTPNQKIEACQNYEGVAISDSCVSAINTADNLTSNNSNANPGSAYKEVLQTYNLELFREVEVVNRKGVSVSAGGNNFYKADEYYLYDYSFLISTAVGVGLCWILLGFCLDMAVRVVKLGFLQIIAPIPIILSLAPTQKNNTLGNWGKECISTWASLFIRVMVISFALSLVVTVNNGGIFSFVTGGNNKFSIVTVFVMIGILLFAKEFPKLLEDILGIKGAGKMTFNALKKFGEVPLVGGVAAGAMTMGGALGLAAGRGAWGLTKSLGAGVGDLAAGGWSKLRGKSFSDGFDGGRRFKNQFSDTGKRMATRMAAGGTSAKEKITSAGIMGTNKLGGSMHKAYAEGYSKDYKKSIDNYNKGEKLLEKATRYDNEKAKNPESSKDKYSIYQHKDFAEKVRDMDDAKERKDTYANEYQKLKMRYDAGEEVTYKGKSGNEAVQEASIDAGRAEGLYNKAKAAFDNIKVRYKSDADRYTAYSAAEDRHKVTATLSEYRGSDSKAKEDIKGAFTQTSTSGNRMDRMENAIVGAINQGFANMNDSSKQVNGVKVTPTSSGEYRTPSGIYVPGSAVNSGVNNPTSVPQNNPQPTSPQSGSQPPKTGFAGSPTARTTKGGQNQ